MSLPANPDDTGGTGGGGGGTATGGGSSTSTSTAAPANRAGGGGVGTGQYPVRVKVAGQAAPGPPVPVPAGATVEVFVLGGNTGDVTVGLSAGEAQFGPNSYHNKASYTPVRYSVTSLSDLWVFGAVGDGVNMRILRG